MNLYNNMGKFSTERFSDSTSVDHLIKMKNEADEAILASNDIFEYADCLLALYAASYKAGFTYDELIESCEKKLEILKLRNWKKIEDGTYQHY